MSIGRTVFIVSSPCPRCGLLKVESDRDGVHCLGCDRDLPEIPIGAIEDDQRTPDSLAITCPDCDSLVFVADVENGEDSIQCPKCEANLMIIMGVVGYDVISLVDEYVEETYGR